MSTSVWPFTFLRPYSERPIHATTRQGLNNGRELRRAERGTYGQMVISGRVRLPYASQTLTTWLAWWQARQGAYDSFLVKCHHAANKTSSAEAVGTGDGSDDTWPLDFKYVDTSTLTVTVNGVAKTSPGDYALTGNNTAPILDFATAPSNGHAIVATYDYYRLVRMEMDDFDPSDMHLTGSDSTAVVEFSVRMTEVDPGGHRV